jgi:hypothetical protein
MTKKSLRNRQSASRKSMSKDEVRQISNFFNRWHERLVNNKLVMRMTVGRKNFLARRPHRSFRRTYRRDYERSLAMPGYVSFTYSVQKILWNHRRTFLCVVLAYAVMTVMLMNLSSETLYTQMRNTIDETSGSVFSGFWGEIGKAGLLLTAGMSGSFTDTSAGTQMQISAAIVALLTWLTTVWLLRAILAGRKPKMRDGLYNAGAPLVSTLLISIVIILQALPLVLALFGYGAAVSSGLLEGGAEAMVFWSVAALLVILSFYWITSTLIALVVVTLPGMYPMQALRTAGDLVVGRRLRILLRLLWMGLMIAVAWAVIVIPIILFDGWVKSVWSVIDWLPLVPITLLIMSSITVVWAASYVYLLYRRIVEDDALPA